MTVPTLLRSTVLVAHLLNVKLHKSSGVKVVGVQTIQIVVFLMPAHNPSSPIRRIDHLSMATMVLATSQQGQIVMAAGRAKMGVRDSKETAFYAVSLTIGHQSVHPMAGCNRYLHSYLSKANCSKKAECWAVCCCMWERKFTRWFGA